MATAADLEGGSKLSLVIEETSGICGYICGGITQYYTGTFIPYSSAIPPGAPFAETRANRFMGVHASFYTELVEWVAQQVPIAGGGDPGPGPGPCPPTEAPIIGAPIGLILQTQPTFRWSQVPGAQTYTLYVLREADGSVVLRQTFLTGTEFTPTTPLPGFTALKWKVKGECENGTRAGPYSRELSFTIQGGVPCPPIRAPSPVGPSGTISNPQPTFNWTAVPGAETYTLYVLRIPDDAVIVRAVFLTTTSYTPEAPLPGGQMRWKVKGECAEGTQAGPYSQDVFFDVAGGGPCPPTQAPVPGGPSGTITSTRPTFTWSAVFGAQSYTIYVVRVSDEAILIRDGTNGALSLQPATPLPTGVQLRWKVKGECASGGLAGPYSPLVYFTISP